MIRRAVTTDHPWIARVASEVYADLGDYGAIIPSWLEHPGVLAYVEQGASNDGGADIERRGFILLGFYQPAYDSVHCDRRPCGSPDAYVADLLAIAVDPQYQRQGVGRALLEYAIHIAGLASRSNDIPEMRLTVADTNIAGQSLFTSSGFRVLDLDHGSYDGGQRAIRMSRQLSPPLRRSAAAGSLR